MTTDNISMKPKRMPPRFEKVPGAETDKNTASPRPGVTNNSGKPALTEGFSRISGPQGGQILSKKTPPAQVSMPASQSAKAQTIATIENVRFLEIPLASVEAKVLNALSSDSTLAAKLSKNQVAGLAAAILTFANARKEVGGIIEAFVAATSTSAADQTKLPGASKVMVGRVPTAAKMVRVANARIEGNEMVVMAQFDGGFVREHVIEAYWDGVIRTTRTPQLAIKLVDRTTDGAQVSLSQEVRIDISALLEALLEVSATARLYVNGESLNLRLK